MKAHNDEMKFIPSRKIDGKAITKLFAPVWTVGSKVSTPTKAKIIDDNDIRAVFQAEVYAAVVENQGIRRGDIVSLMGHLIRVDKLEPVGNPPTSYQLTGTSL